MNSTVFNRIKSKLGWLIKRNKLKKYGSNCHVGYNLVLKNPKQISIGNNFTAGKNLTLEVWNEYKEIMFDYKPEIFIGENVSIMDDCQFSCAKGIYIGSGTLLGNNVFITDNFHGNNSKEQLSVPPADRPLSVKGEVRIGENVWIGRNVCIMPGVVIGNGSVIGANAVVTKDVPPFKIFAGVPANEIK